MAGCRTGWVWDTVSLEAVTPAARCCGWPVDVCPRTTWVAVGPEGPFALVPVGSPGQRQPFCTACCSVLTWLWSYHSAQLG